MDREVPRRRDHDHEVRAHVGAHADGVRHRRRPRRCCRASTCRPTARHRGSGATSTSATGPSRSTTSSDRRSTSRGCARCSSPTATSSCRAPGSSPAASPWGRDSASSAADSRAPAHRLTQFDFDDVRGSLLWTRDKFEVLESRMAFAGGQLDLNYKFAPIGAPTPAHQRLDARYTRRGRRSRCRASIGLEGMEVAGRADGRHLLDFPSGSVRPAHRRRRGRCRRTGRPAHAGARADRPDRRTARCRRRCSIGMRRSGGCRSSPTCTTATRAAASTSHAATRPPPRPTSSSAAAPRRSRHPDFDFHVTQPRLAGERQAAGRHHDRRRCAHASCRGRRLGHVRRHDDRSLPGAAHRRAVRGPQPAGLGRELGDRPHRRWSSRTATSTSPMPRSRAATPGCACRAASRSASRDAMAARRCAHASRCSTGRCATCGMRSSSTTTRSTARSPATSSCRATIAGRWDSDGFASRTASATTSPSTPRRPRSVSMASACSSTTSSSPSPPAT